MSTLPRTPPAAHATLKSILLGLVILAAGAAIGASLTLMVLGPAQGPQPQAPEAFAEQMLHRLTGELDLTVEQRGRLEPILQAHHRALQDIRAEARPRIVAQLEQLDHDIAAVLDERQSRLWQQQVQRLEDYFPTLRERRRGGGGPGRGAGLEPGQRGPHGPRQPLGPGFRRNAHRDGAEGEPPSPPDPATTAPDPDHRRDD